MRKINKRILRVFPKRNSYIPDDDMALIGEPPLSIFIPEHDEVHISCTFTWDKFDCEYLRNEWAARTDKPVKLGGVAYESPCEGFVQGLYLKRNIIFTSRGCNNNCPWCCVPRIEGKLRELPEIYQGNIIQDNNFLQTSRAHKDKVFEMLKTQKGICFKGGLEADLLDDHFIDNITSLHIAELWLACDTDGRLPELKKACEKLTKAGFTRDKIKCYVLIGINEMDKDEARLRAVYEAGAMPFAQLYRHFADFKTPYSREHNAFARMWQRPAIIKSHMKQTEVEDEQ